MIPAALIVLALAFAFTNGYNDSGGLVATVISTGAIGARRALLLAAAANFVGPFIFGVAVAVVVGTSIVDPTSITLASIAVALLAALGWNVLASAVGVPSSSSHALLGGLIGGAIGAGGPHVVKLSGLAIVALALVVAPVLAYVAALQAMRMTLWLAQGASPGINEVFRRSQLVTSILLAISHGTSDAQKTMGVIALVLYRAGLAPGFSVPNWVVFVSAVWLSLGVGLGGWRVIRTLGARMYRLRPVDGFVSQTTATLIVLGATLLGGPVSLNQVATSAILGAGAAQRRSKIRWEAAQMTLYSWAITLPATCLVALALYPLAALIVA